MTQLWFLLFWILIAAGKNNALEVTNSTVGYENSLDVSKLDRDWENYVNELKKLKPDEMKKAIRKNVLEEKVRPYFSLREICKRLELLKMYDPQRVDVGFVKDIEMNNLTYRTVSGQGIVYIKISGSDQESDRNKKKKAARSIIVIVAGIGGSDWLTVQSAMHIITRLATINENKALHGFDWWIIPLLNPDGYRASYDNKMSRIYKTNINPSGGCWGVNLDRNFLQQKDSCRGCKKLVRCQEYPGEKPFSEAETCALRDFISPRVNDCKVFVALKEGFKALVYPFASASTPPPGSQTVVQNLLCVEALEAFDEYNTGKTGRFKFGNSGSILGLNSGFVEDWAKKHMGIPRSFAFHMVDKFDGYVEKVKKIDDYEKGTMKLLEILATSRRTEPYAETFEELIFEKVIDKNFTKNFESRPIQWGREFVPGNLLQKINRGANLKMPEEFTKIKGGKRFRNVDFKSKN